MLLVAVHTIHKASTGSRGERKHFFQLLADFSPEHVSGDYYANPESRQGPSAPATQRLQ